MVQTMERPAQINFMLLDSLSAVELFWSAPLAAVERSWITPLAILDHCRSCTSMAICQGLSDTTYSSYIPITFRSSKQQIWIFFFFFKKRNVLEEKEHFFTLVQRRADTKGMLVLAILINYYLIIFLRFCTFSEL